jgi:hypothetical protein
MGAHGKEKHCGCRTWPKGRESDSQKAHTRGAEGNSPQGRTGQMGEAEQGRKTTNQLRLEADHEAGCVSRLSIAGFFSRLRIASQHFDDCWFTRLIGPDARHILRWIVPLENLEVSERMGIILLS